MIKVLFITENTGFPVPQEGGVITPIECVGGYFFTDCERHRNACDGLELAYEVKDYAEIELIEIEIEE